MYGKEDPSEHRVTSKSYLHIYRVNEPENEDQDEVRMSTLFDIAKRLPMPSILPCLVAL